MTSSLSGVPPFCFARRCCVAAHVGMTDFFFSLPVFFVVLTIFSAVSASTVSASVSSSGRFPSSPPSESSSALSIICSGKIWSGISASSISASSWLESVSSSGVPTVSLGTTFCSCSGTRLNFSLPAMLERIHVWVNLKYFSTSAFGAKSWLNWSNLIGCSFISGSRLYWSAILSCFFGNFMGSLSGGLMVSPSSFF